MSLSKSFTGDLVLYAIWLDFNFFHLFILLIIILLLISLLTVECPVCLMIQNRENLFEEMLQEPDEIASKRKRTRETLRVLQQAFRVGSL